MTVLLSLENGRFWVAFAGRFYLAPDSHQSVSMKPAQDSTDFRALLFGVIGQMA